MLRQLDNMHLVAERAKRLADSHTGIPRDLRRRLSFLGEDNTKNLSAVKNLSEMGSEKPRYLYFGADPRLGRILPGVRVQVLGPPTLEQSEAIRKQRAKDRDQFWMLAARSSSAVSGSSALFAEQFVERDEHVSEEVRWLTERVDRAQAEQLLGIVTALDSAMNNTSLILLFEVKGKKMLFAGDAQIENWEYALSRPRIRRKLADVDVYKVGHHGSRNATPKSLWNAFSKRSQHAAEPHRLTTLLSTEAGKHGSEATHTEVPRTSLVEELKAKSHFHTTEETALGPGAPYEDVVIQF
jgi:hypothetical protein